MCMVRAICMVSVKIIEEAKTWNSKMVSLKLGDLSLILGTTEGWKERTDFTKLPSDLHTHAMHEHTCNPSAERRLETLW